MKKRFLFFLMLPVLLASPFIQAQELVSSTYLKRFTEAELKQSYGSTIQYAVDLYKINYTTTDLEGLTDTASGLFVVPLIEEADLPLLCYQHGTVSSREDVPSNMRGGFELPVVWGGLGYAAAAADYLGLGDSRGFHPYVHAETEARAAIDMLLAVRVFAGQNDISLNDQLFITGYSQGGHGAMAAHQVIERDFRNEFTVTASAPMSGPYSISGEMRQLIIGDQEYLFPNYVCWTLLSYNLAHNLGYTVEEIFKEPYSTVIRQFFEEKMSLSTLNTLLLVQIKANNDDKVLPKVMLQDSIFTAFVNDPQHPFNLALKENDVFNWAPQAPTLLPYCRADEQVTFRNSVVADSVMNLLGAVDVEAVDVKSDANHGQCVEPAVGVGALFFSQFRRFTVPTNSLQRHGEQISVYPNPAEEVIHLKTELMGRIEIVDVAGRLIATVFKDTEQETLAIDVGDLPSGLYILRFMDDRRKMHSAKFVKD